MAVKMGQKIGISLFLLIAIFLAFCSFAYISLADIAQDVSDIRLAQERAFLAVRIELNYTGAVLDIRRYLADGIPAYKESTLQGYGDVQRQEQMLLALTPGQEATDMIADVIKKTDAYVTGVTGEYLPLHEEEKRARAAGDDARADELAVKNRAALSAFTSQARDIQSGLRAISVHNEEIISARLASVIKASESLVGALWFLALVSLLVAAFLGYRLTKSVTAPLAVMTRSMDEMAAGSFDRDTSPEILGRSDEFGLMAASLATMKRNTRDLIGELHENQAQMRALLTASPDLIIRFSGDGRYLEVIEPSGWNPFNIAGIRIGCHLSEVLPDHLAELYMAGITNTLASGQPQTFEYEAPDSVAHWTRECRTYKKADDEVVFIVRDITHRRKVEETLRQIVEGMSGSTGREFFDYLTDYFAQTFNVRYCFIGEFLGHGRISLLSSMVRGARLNPFSFEAEADQPSHEVYHGSDVIYREKIWQHYPFFRNIQGSVAESAAKDTPAESEPRHMETYIGVPLKDSSGSVLGIMALMDERPLPNAELIIAVFRIFAARVAAELERLVNERRIQRMAYYDALTGLPNRWRITELLDQAVAQAAGHPGTVAILRFDIDNFRYVNDSIGRAAGDRLFVAATERLRQGVAGICPACEIARLDGDNFIVLIKDADARKLAEEIAQAMISSLAQPFQAGERDLYLNTSIGISLHPWHGETSEELFNNAERALNYAKETAKGSVQFYDPYLQTEAIKKIALLNDLRNAITNEEFVLFYQPQYHAFEERLVGVEALLRWKHPNKGMIAPLDFIPLAESSGLIIPIGEWVLNQACRQLRAWLDDGAAPIRVAVNISAVQFNQPRFVDEVRRAIATSGIPANLLELEITENVTMHGVDKIRDKLAEITAMGVIVSIDDFGTGYSSLSYLQTFPLYSLKIDRGFVRNLHTNQANADIVSAVIALAHSLSLKVVAEGVETEAELGILKAKNCDIIQGYYFGHPQPAEQLTIPKD